MIKRIPTDSSGLYKQPNISDIFGNVWYSKSVMYDLLGYLKIASRTVLLKSERTTPNFDLPLEFGRYAEGEFLLTTAKKPFTASINPSAITVLEDTIVNAPDFRFGTGARWWQNRWHATTNDGMWYRTPTGNQWYDTGITLSAGKAHPLEVFKNRNTICVANGNQVKQFDTSYSNAGGVLDDLTIPSDFEIIGLAYSNNRMGIITRLGNDTEGQNQDAYFFVWDGASPEANTGFPIGSDAAVAVVSYKSSWVVITRTGQILYFNGGGFTTLATLPFYYMNKIWGDFLNRVSYGDAIAVEGERIFINLDITLQPTVGKNQERYLENNPSGVLCYDPNVGIYHRFSPSISPAYITLATSSDVSTSAGTITKTSGTITATGTPVKYTEASGQPIGGLVVGQIYYTIQVTPTKFRLAATKADALNNNAITLTSQGVGSHYFMFLELKDYGAAMTAGRASGIGLQGSQSTVYDHVIFGGDYYRDNSGQNDAGLCMSVPGFKNWGYVVLAKQNAPLIEAISQKLWLKFKPLGQDEKIIVKVKVEDVGGLPVTTPQNNSLLTAAQWNSTIEFETTANLSDALAWYEQDRELECELLAGAGAGQMAQVSSIVYNETANTYTVTLADQLDGVDAGQVSQFKLDVWKMCGIATNETPDGYAEFSSDYTGKWQLWKVIMVGSDVTIEEAQIVDTVQRES